MLTTTVLGLKYGYDVGESVAPEDWDALIHSLEDMNAAAELFPEGIFDPAHFNGTTTTGTLIVPVSNGMGVLGAVGNRRFVRNPDPVDTPALPASEATVYVWLKPDGTLFASDDVLQKPANSHLIGIAATNATEVTAWDSNPPGRVNISTVLPPYVTFTVGVEASNAIDVVVQFKDSAGNNLLQNSAVLLWLSDAAAGVESGTAPTGGWAAQAGLKLADEVANLRGYFLAPSGTGALTVRITHTGAKTWYLNALLGNRVYSSGAIAFT